ncbi:MAG: hypothetical protein FWB99_06650 [Treponema sp.]|nr:hypothetical protein [Treponema sp.]
MAAHGYPRSTMDIDLWVMPDPENALLEFEGAFSRSDIIEIDAISVHVLSIPDLIKNKRATGRTKDLADAELLEEAR